ncbi:hypothetical protein KBB96_07165 [Luteolibacter ambystomatis]|uniref:Uncharacterized protein n=1 Tax=Luteolibacter ambystomatis TaxID=2824561 RepID=A0A975J297_9BACT|nr:hypothetical protein [Luteolibacter ambystomatis]QUE52667.1 hypothetical protein KBB96_07165 [Luteolibacter ambystomatis]
MRPLLPSACLLLLASAIAPAETPGANESTELTNLRAIYESQRKALDEQYRSKLDTLAKIQIQQGNTGGAVATREELRKLDTATAPVENASAPHVETNPFYSGTKWWESNGGSVVEFRSNGIWSENYHGCEFFGRWKTNGLYNSVTVTLPDGNMVEYSASADGAHCTRVRDKLYYEKSSTFFRSEAMAGISVIGNAPIPLASSPYSGSRWETLNGQAVIEFKADGSWVEHWDGKDTPGKWTTTAIKTEVKVTWPKSEPLVFATSDDGLFTLRTNDHKLFKLMNTKGAAPSGNSDKGGSNPRQF